MREVSIKIAPYEFIDITELSIHKKVNEHASAKIAGHISEDVEDKYVEMAGENDWITISAKDEEGNENVIFKGIVKSAAVKMCNNVRLFEVEAVSGSYLMDIDPKSRTFQNAQQTYQNIINTVVQDYSGGGVYMAEGDNKTTGTMIVQYCETDWKFVKRLASSLNTVVVPDCRVGGVKIYFGRYDSGQEVRISPMAYTVKKDIGEYMDKLQNKVDGITEADSVYYVIQSREIYDLCDKIVFKGKGLCIYEINSSLKGAVLIHDYSLKGGQGFKTKKQYNEKLIGASIGAKIIDVQKDRVKVQMEVDDNQDVGKATWLPYSTVYSSPDGTGWYCMPEKGDTVRVYMPNEKEKCAYVISAVHEQSSNQESRSDPNVKVLSTKYGKNISFSEKRIEIKSDNGMSIVLDDDEGITIESDKEIKIHSKEDMSIASGKKIEMCANDKITFVQGEKSKIEINKEDITLSSGQVKME